MPGRLGGVGSFGPDSPVCGRLVAAELAIGNTVASLHMTEPSFRLLLEKCWIKIMVFEARLSPVCGVFSPPVLSLRLLVQLIQVLRQGRGTSGCHGKLDFAGEDAHVLRALRLAEVAENVGTAVVLSVACKMFTAGRNMKY